MENRHSQLTLSTPVKPYKKPKSALHIFALLKMEMPTSGIKCSEPEHTTHHHIRAQRKRIKQVDVLIKK